MQNEAVYAEMQATLSKMTLTHKYRTTACLISHHGTVCDMRTNTESILESYIQASKMPNACFQSAKNFHEKNQRELRRNLPRLKPLSS